jgi:ergothioneine biosynthesis protein EgtB
MPESNAAAGSRVDRASVVDSYRAVRNHTEWLARPLSAEDQTLQSMPDASPTKWHRAHTTWFFETFVLVPFAKRYEEYDPEFGFLFNSYYEAVGPRHPRSRRGLVSRPGVTAIAAYRSHVDAAMHRLLEEGRTDCLERVVLGLHHEQQHQELLLTDIKHALHCNPTLPAYAPGNMTAVAPPMKPLEWRSIEGGIHGVGHSPAPQQTDFAFDNETPPHDVLLRDFSIASRPVSNGEFLAFMEDGGYRRPEVWLSDGWAAVQSNGWEAPDYWHKRGDAWHAYTLHGLRPLRHDEPVCHVSYFEAAAFAEWAKARLPTEFEWEVAARMLGGAQRSAETPRLHPHTLQPGFAQDVWEWTASAYAPYPGYRPQAGALGEYNGKFMINQMVLRGRSLATPPGHDRLSYRNFFPPGARWQFSGFRLAK